MEISPKPKICFILGINQRSGTNFIYRLLGEHPSCAASGPIWEDHFLRHSKMLIDYANALFKSWNPIWEVEKKIGGQEMLLRHFGDAIEHFLRLQVIRDFPHQIPPKLLLTKTPNVIGLDNFFDLFPGAYLILLVRDGRAVVESGVRSFDWNYEDAMWKWRAAARAILSFQEKHRTAKKKFIILKYEDLVMNEKHELLKLFGFLGLDPELFDFNSTKALGVTGSSESRKQGAPIFWKEVTQKKADFDPLARFANWDRKKQERFNWIAGQDMTRLGYDLDLIKGNKRLYAVKHTLMDMKKFLKDMITGRGSAPSGWVDAVSRRWTYRKGSGNLFSG